MSRIQNPTGIPTGINNTSQPINAPFVPSQGRVGTPMIHPAIPAHRDAVITPLMPQRPAQTPTAPKR